MLLIGDDLTIIAYYVLRSESWKELEPGLQFLNDRLERLGTIEHVEAWWSDRCCEGVHRMSPSIQSARFSASPISSVHLTRTHSM